MEWLTDPKAWTALVALTALEIVLGIDNIVFIAILSGKLPEGQQAKARQVGLGIALITRVLLLLAIGWVMSLTTPLFRLGPEPAAAVAGAAHGAAAHPADPLGISGRDLILLAGGLFLVWKSVVEIHAKLEGEESHAEAGPAAAFGTVLAQILLLDVVFSLDSVITAVGMVPPSQLMVMIISVVISTIFMLIFSTALSNLVAKHPTVKMLALAFLVLIGANLLGEGFEQHIEKGYTYFAMAFAVAVEFLNLRLRKKEVEPVHLRTGFPYSPPGGSGGPVPAD